MKSRLARASAALLAASLARPAAADPWRAPPLAEGPALDAMEGELRRALGRLRQDSFGPPYFLAYRLHDVRRHQVSASLGEVLGEESEDRRVAYVEARYGDAAFDNVDLSYQGVHGPAPGDAAGLAEAFWGLTDQAYKAAIAGWLEKRAKRATELVAEPLDDLAPEPPVRVYEPQPGPSLDAARLRTLARDLSRVFRGYPGVHDSRVGAEAWWIRRLLVTSEGARLAGPGEAMPHELRVSASARADDGMRVESARFLPLRSWDELPPRRALEALAREVAEEVSALRRAPAQDAAAAPAILDPEMAGVLFHEALGHKLEGQRQRDPRESQVFRDLVGREVLPAFLSVHDDPAMASFRGVPLHGSYSHDAEGTPARRVTLVEKGVLRGFLTSRWPVKGFPRSNGHGRSDWRSHPTGRMANLVVEPSRTSSLDELHRRLLELTRAAGKPYGFLLAGSGGGENPTNRESAQTLEVRPRLVYRVDAATGRRTLVRGVKLVGTPLVLLNRILAAGDDATLSNGFHCGAESGWVPVSQIAPSLLLSEVELQRLPESRARPPILPSPLHDREPKN